MDNDKQMRLEEEMQEKADRLYHKYQEQVSSIEGKGVFRYKEFSPYDAYALGSMLEQYENYQRFVEYTYGSVSDLGQLPKVALDVISIAYAGSILPLIASTQPIEEEKGIVYFKKVIANDSRGDITSGDTLWTARNQDGTSGNARPVHPTNYAGELIENEELATTSAAQSDYAITRVDYPPIRRHTLTITIEDLGVIGHDDGGGTVEDCHGNLKVSAAGEGNIVGPGICGTVTYENGAMDLQLCDAPSSGGEPIYGTYATNFELSDDIPEISTILESTDVCAEVFALKHTFGRMMSFAVNKRFGLVMEDEAAKDLAAEIISETGNSMVVRLANNAQGLNTWDRTAAEGVSYYEHQMTFKNTLADAEQTLYDNTGRGTISTMLASSGACAVMQTLPGWVKAPTNNMVGPQVYGTLDGVVVIRCPNLTVPAGAIGTVLALYKGASVFEAPAVYAPYMPLFITSTLPAGTNPLRQQRAAGLWAGIKVVENNFITRVNIIES